MRFILDALLNPNTPLVLVYGGKLMEEYKGSNVALRILSKLASAGRARLVSSAEIEADAQTVTASGELRSNDAHIISLARVSNTRSIATDDLALIKDIKNKKLLDKPRGYVVTQESHLGGVRQRCKCRRDH